MEEEINDFCEIVSGEYENIKETYSNSENLKRKISNNDCCNPKLDFYKKFYTKNDINKLSHFYKKFLYNLNRAMNLYERELVKNNSYEFKIFLGNNKFNKIFLTPFETEERYFLCKEILSGEA